VKGDITVITIRPGNERGGGDYGWLKTRHTFSFNDYNDTKWMGFRSVRVINEDWVAPDGGFPTHPHRDMEIITYVLSGKLEHKDSLGTGSVILPGDGQRMTAGRGIRHSEANPSSTESVHLLQIWIFPDKQGHEPGYEQKSFPESEKRGKLRLIASNDGAEGSVKINQDAKLFVTQLASGEEVTQSLGAKRYAWIQVAKGEVELNDQKLRQGDGAAISKEKKLKIRATEDAEVLLFDLA
jgi:redox-sensitive bicupin YhaK (pirin superfamily)